MICIVVIKLVWWICQIPVSDLYSCNKISMVDLSNTKVSDLYSCNKISMVDLSNTSK